MDSSEFKCHFCTVCNGTGCIGQLPGMGGVNRNINFRLNCDGWEVCRKENPLLFVNFLQKPAFERKPRLALAPMTGAVENIGYRDEKQYYLDIFSAAFSTGIDVCVGDGFPDEKIKYGIDAVRQLNARNPEFKASFFIKPFENPKILEHASLALPYAKIVGVDIDSYNIFTMQNLIKLEKKTAAQLLEIKEFVHHHGARFAIKGIFTKDSLQIVKEVQPDIAYISNHGGRVDTTVGSTAEFLQNYGDDLKQDCQELWVDGGIRSSLDVATAMAFGADVILVGRPLISALCKGGQKSFTKKVLDLTLLQYGM